MRGDPEAVDVYLCEQRAQHALEDCLRDEPSAEKPTEALLEAEKEGFEPSMEAFTPITP